MPTFQYVASGSKGESVRGTLSATDKNEVSKKLSERGLFLVFCKEEEVSKSSHAMTIVTKKSMVSGNGTSNSSAAASTGTYPNSNATSSNKQATTGSGAKESSTASAWWSHLKHQKTDAANQTVKKVDVSLKELVICTRQISISINAGMSFVDALQGISTSTKNLYLGFVLKSVLDDILSGRKLSESLATHPDVFDTVYVSMVSAGEAGGFLPEALNRIAEFIEKEIELRSKIKSAMVYPAVIAVVASLVLIGMMIFIIPVFIRVFEDMNAPLPFPTRLLIHMSAFTRNGGFLTPLIVVGIIWYMRKLRTKNEKFRVFYDEKVLQLPLFGKIIVLDIITRFIRTLATLVENGVMALQAVQLARKVVENRSIEKVVDEIYESIQQGNGIASVLYKSSYFPVLVGNMVATGEKTGALPEVLMKMAKYYEDEVSAKIRDLLTLMEPLLIVCMAVIVGFIIAGLMLPTFQMSSLVN